MTDAEERPQLQHCAYGLENALANHDQCLSVVTRGTSTNTPSSVGAWAPKRKMPPGALTKGGVGIRHTKRIAPACLQGCPAALGSVGSLLSKAKSTTDHRSPWTYKQTNKQTRVPIGCGSSALVRGGLVSPATRPRCKTFSLLPGTPSNGPVKFQISQVSYIFFQNQASTLPGVHCSAG